jgi:hypothetical protein
LILSFTHFAGQQMKRPDSGSWKVVYCAGAVAVALIVGKAVSAADGVIEFQLSDGSIAVTVDGEPFATYVYQDKAISRPYFAHVKAPGGIQATRNHPPVEGVDSPDHGTFHPGIWMSFGDINGSDFWRLAAPVRFDRMLIEPTGGEGRGHFAARFNYQDQENPSETVCNEDFHCTIHATGGGRLIVWDSTFSSDKEFTFGDQEEMGLGGRVATPIRAERESEIGLPPGNGEIVSSSGAQNESEIWGNTADWCDYRGELQDKRIGIALFPHPENFRPSWFHARDYGMIVANPFGRDAFGKGEKSAVTVKPGEKFRLRYGVYVHAGPSDEQPDIAAAYETYLKLAQEQAED